MSSPMSVGVKALSGADRAEAPTGSLAAEDEFRQLVDAQTHFLRRALLRLAGPHLDLDDLLQETLVVVFRRWADFADRSEPRRWLYSIAVRVVSGARRQARRQRRLGETTDAWDDDALERYLQDPETPALALERREAFRQAYRILDRFPENWRNALVLADLEGLSIADVAAVLGCRVDAARRTLDRSRRAFASALDQVQRAQ